MTEITLVKNAPPPRPPLTCAPQMPDEEITVVPFWTAVKPLVWLWVGLSVLAGIAGFLHGLT